MKVDHSHWRFGPYHASLPGPLRLELELDGEVIVSGKAEAGFLHRGLEKAAEAHSWSAIVPYADRLDPEGAAFAELAVCLAVEELAGIEVPERARFIRVILCELNRVSCHHGYLLRIARSVGGETMMQYLLRDRERVLDLFELLTGSRFTLNFLRFGGVREDVTEGFIERVIEACETLRFRLGECNELFARNETFMRRATGIGIIPRDWILEAGVTGPNARASLVGKDLRKSEPYSGYDRFDFELPAGSRGDAQDRFNQRLAEIAQSIEILRQALERLPAGEFSSMRMDPEIQFPAGEAYARVEGAHGLLGCHLVSDGGTRPARVQFRPSTRSNFQLIPKLLEGHRLEDLPFLLASLDLVMAEVDR